MPQNKKILVVSFQSLTAKSAGGMARLGYFVSEELHKRGLLKKFVVHAKGKYETEFPSEPVTRLSRYFLFALNKLAKKTKMPAHKFRLLQEYLYDLFCQKHIKDDVAILFTTNAHMKRTFAKAKKKGIPIIYVPANQEETHIYKLVKIEQKKLGIETIDAYTYLPRLHFYNESIKLVDTVVGTYPTVYDSYAKKANSQPYKAVSIIGHIKPDLKPYVWKKRTPNDIFKVGYLAHTVVLKGLQYLLEAWELLMKEQPNLTTELYIAGYIEPKLKAYVIERYGALNKVHFTGRLDSITDYFIGLDLFVIPSLSEGGPYTALEAANYGTPVLLTDSCGSAELLNRNEKGCIVVPYKNAKSIKEQIVYAYNNREELKQIGLTGKKNLDSYDTSQLYQEIADYLEKEIATEQ